jgi:MoaA/NifB/PqqE/SkfB family radical SAM enzyme
MAEQVATIDFHVTSECHQECPYCWGPQGFEHPVDTATARRIIARIKEVGAAKHLRHSRWWEKVTKDR